jgi:hypothetical protein
MKESDDQNAQQPTPKLKKLMPQQVQKIDDYLASIEDYGEVRLVVQNGQLRYINKLISYLVSTGDPKKKNKQQDTK